MAGRAPVVWSETFRVRAYEVDASRYASVPAMCNWLQEAAGNHATALGWAVDELQARGLTWVLSRLHLRLAGRPGWRDDVTVTTWPAGVQRLFALREFRVSSAGAGELGVATTAWLLVNSASLRPVRPPAAVEGMAAGGPGRVLDDTFAKLPDVAVAELDGVFDVRFTDLDMNRHANNVSVIGAMFEALPENVAVGRALAELEIEFRAEALRGDRLRVQAQRVGEEGCRFLHRLLRESDGREVARASTAWAALPES
jgi:acyl-ACP thioesterase